MSDLLEKYSKIKLDWQLKVCSEAPLTYVRQQADLFNEIIFCVQIPWPLLCIWHDLFQSVSGEHVNYIDVLNSTVPDKWFVLKRNNQRIDEVLRKECSAVSSVCRRTKGRKRKSLNDKVYRLSVKRGEIETIEQLKTEVSIINQEFQEFKEKYHNLENEKQALYEEMLSEVNGLKEEVCDLKTINKQLMDYVDTLEKTDSLQCQGKRIPDVGKKQQSRKLRMLKNRAQCALWFCESFGLKLSHINFKDDTGGNYSLDYQTPNGSSDLSEDDQCNLEKVLFLLDKFCVGDEFYHELSMLSEDLPRSYLIKQQRSNLNKTSHIERTLGQFPGARINFTSTLADHVKDLLTDKPELKQEKIQVKLSGDGARMTRSTNFMMFSFALLQKPNVMSSKSNRTVAIVNGKEEYETLASSLKDFFQEVNSLIEQGAILIDGQKVKLEFFLGGDFKFLAMIMGINSATANFACLWCKVHKQNRWDTSKSCYFFHEDDQKRTLEEIKNLCQKKGDNFGCIHPPLINIDLDHVVPDELHLLLRITDRLLENIIDEILERDSITDFNKPKGSPKGLLLQHFVNDVNDLGITFSTWYKKNADGSRSNILEYTSCVGAQKKLLLRKLPSILAKYLYPDTAEIVCKIWTDFKIYYDFVTDSNLESTSADEAFSKAKMWIELFCSLRQSRPGYTKARVTPYMHIMCYHVPSL